MTGGSFQSQSNPLKDLTKETPIALQFAKSNGQYTFLRITNKDSRMVADFVSGGSNAAQLFVVRNQDGRIAFGTVYKPSWLYTSTATLYLQK